MRPSRLHQLVAAAGSTVLLAGVPSRLLAQGSPPATAAAPTTPAARPEDVASIDAIIAAVYDVISGPKGQARDWNRMRSLFIPGARLIPTGKKRDGTGFGSRVLSVEDYISASAKPLEDAGFREKEIARRTERYGNIAQAFSTYASYRGDETTPFQRGINSIQLWNDGSRWWIVTIFWEGERPDNPIPQRFLKGRSENGRDE